LLKNKKVPKLLKAPINKNRSCKNTLEALPLRRSNAKVSTNLRPLARTEMCSHQRASGLGNRCYVEEEKIMCVETAN